MATAPSPNDLTRQQLDELDALLQRMLSVPLAPADTPMPASAPPGRSGSDGPPLPPSWRVDPPTPAAGASLPHIALPEPSPSVTPKFEPPPAPPPAPAKKPAAVAPTPKPPAPAPAPKAAPPVVPPAKPQAAPTPPTPAAPPVPLLLVPLVAFNALFDSICGLFGPLGRLFRSGFFKHIYGLVGLGLIAYTAAHVAQKEGWLSLPITLPWPR